jgi:large subunit ribosomal protein L18
MTDAQRSKHLNRERRHARVRARITGTSERPRVVVFKSNQFTYAQAIDDTARRTVAAADDREGKGAKAKRASGVGRELGVALKKLKIEAAVFDRAGFKYHGRVQAVADGLREEGIRV